MSGPLLGLLVGAVVLLVVPGPGRPLPFGGREGRAPGTVPGGRWLASVRGRRRDAGPDRTAPLLEAFVSELRAGRSASLALCRAGELAPDLVRTALGAARLGGDVPAALEFDATAADAPVLRRFAACWRVGAGTGAGLADSVERLALARRDAQRLRLELRARTAEPRATMRVLAALPLTGVMLGALLGADTLGWLVGTGPGRVVLVAGVSLDLAGLVWARRIVGSVQARL